MAYDARETLEKYLNHEPLNEELAAIREGNVDLLPHPVEKTAPKRGSGRIDDPERDLTRAERLDLRELRQSDGWPVLMRLLLKRFLTLEKTAITISQSFPLQNAEGIAQKWHHVGVYKQVASEMELLLEQEIAELQAEE